MIVDPDFLDHWRTRMLVDMLEDELAPLYVIRLWGHCQNRRGWVFDGMPVHATKAICRYPGDAEVLEKALVDCGFLSRQDDEITIVGWDEHNASLIANWANGKRGGRPKGSTKETRKKPMGKPKENPSANPSETDKIGLDGMGVEKENVPPSGGTSAEYPPEFEEAWKRKPRREGGNSKKAAYKQWKARLRAGATVEDLTKGMERYRKYCEAKGIIGTDKVKMMATFWGPDEHYLEDYELSDRGGYDPMASDRSKDDENMAFQRELIRMTRQ